MTSSKRLRPSDGWLISSPKRVSAKSGGRASWFPYYAGYSEQFATSLLASASASRSCLVVDPWNGSGTTTSAASKLGLASHGYDLNPVMVVVAKARMVDHLETPSLLPLCDRLVQEITSSAIAASDPLQQWFVRPTAATLRAIERAIVCMLSINHRPNNPIEYVQQLSDIASFFMVALFRVTRQLLSSFGGSNPTWIKIAIRDDDKVKCSRHDILRDFRDTVGDMVRAIDNDVVHADRARRCSIDIADSRRLPLPNASVDMVLGSPPYCTRIDYAIATRAELAVMNVGGIDLKALRRSLMGTLTVDASVAVDPQWGSTCRRFLDAVKAHTSRASNTYYYKSHARYFGDLFASLHEISRILKPHGASIIVIQDSFYKEVRNDLPRIASEMAEITGCTLVRRENIRVPNTLAVVNPRAKRYRKSAGATESVLCFTRNTTGA